MQADCSLVGGETAEHPGMMPEDEYDLAARFTVGVVDKEKILSNDTAQARRCDHRSAFHRCALQRLLAGAQDL